MSQQHVKGTTPGAAAPRGDSENGSDKPPVKKNLYDPEDVPRQMAAEGIHNSMGRNANDPPKEAHVEPEAGQAADDSSDNSHYDSGMSDIEDAQTYLLRQQRILRDRLKEEAEDEKQWRLHEEEQRQKKTTKKAPKTKK